jgi:hypothetical protein
MKTTLKLTLALSVLWATACTKDPKETTDNTIKGPWDGTYTLVSVTTITEDTADYTVYGGNEIKMWNAFRGDTATTGALVITKDSIRQQNLFINRTESLQYTTYYKNTNQTTVSGTNTTTGQVSTMPANFKSFYSIVGSDSVIIHEPTAIPFPFGSYTAGNSKFRFSYDGTLLTLYNDYRKNETVTSTPNYNHKVRYQSIAKFRKQ